MKTKIGIIAVLCILPFYLFADPAKKVNLTYSPDSKTLRIEAIHPVANVSGHFIDVIKILVDGKEVKVIKPTKQSSLKAETLEVEVGSLKKGSKIEVKTHCNQFGDKSGKLTVK
jgi:hypothetical protein